MPVTFGSVGDIIAVCLLIKDLVVALEDCKGSPHQLHQLVKQLQSLERALLEVDQLVCKYEASPELSALCVAAQQAAQACRASADPFLERVRSYGQYLKSSSLIKIVTHKVKWRALEKHEVERFFAEVTAHVGSLNMLLIEWSMWVKSYSRLEMLDG